MKKQLMNSVGKIKTVEQGDGYGALGKKSKLDGNRAFVDHWIATRKQPPQAVQEADDKHED